MSDKAQLARTGTVAGAIVVGGVAITGYYLLAIAAGIVLIGALFIRFGFRRGKGANQS